MKRPARRLAALCFILAAGIFLSAASPSAGADALPDRCRMEPVNGDCKALMDRVYFDVGARKCRTYFYDGCGPVVPFEDMAECQKTCETGADLRLSEFRRVPGRPFVIVEMEYPKNWPDEPDFTVKLDGREAVFRTIGGGSSFEAKSRTLEIFLGTLIVHELAVEALVDGRTDRAFTEFHWAPQTLVLLLDHVGEQEALLSKGNLRFFVFMGDDPVFRLNGTELPAQKIVGQIDGAAIWQVDPHWAPGRNSVSVRVAGTDAKPVVRDYTFVNMADGRLAFRQKVEIPFGAPGSRSGPFYRLEVEGAAIALGAESEKTFDTLGDDGWLNRTAWLVRDAVGAAPGEAVLRFYETPYFRSPERMTRELRVRVTQGGTP